MKIQSEDHLFADTFYSKLGFNAPGRASGPDRGFDSTNFLFIGNALLLHF